MTTELKTSKSVFEEACLMKIIDLEDKLTEANKRIAEFGWQEWSDESKDTWPKQEGEYLIWLSDDENGHWKKDEWVDGYWVDHIAYHRNLTHYRGPIKPPQGLKP